MKHLLPRCPSCAATLRKLRNEPPCQLPRPEEYDAAFDRTAAFLRELYRTKAPPPRRPGPANIDESGEAG
ncbi:MAG TPA: hypothetical protein VIY56_14335, partial [Vicinamibacterales bacterium]